MSREILRDRERALEYEFFHRVDEQLLEQLRRDLRNEQQLRALADKTGISNVKVLQQLRDLEIGSESLLALSLVPLIRVAWADGSIDEQERQVIQDTAHSLGHERDTESYRLLETWLQQPPGDGLYDAWKAYVQALFKVVRPEWRKHLREDLLYRARKIARAAGGLMGMHKISRAERQVLAELEEILADDKLTFTEG